MPGGPNPIHRVSPEVDERYFLRQKTIGLRNVDCWTFELFLRKLILAKFFEFLKFSGISGTGTDSDTDTLHNCTGLGDIHSTTTKYPTKLWHFFTGKFWFQCGHLIAECVVKTFLNYVLILTNSCAKPNGPCSSLEQCKRRDQAECKSASRLQQCVADTATNALAKFVFVWF